VVLKRVLDTNAVLYLLGGRLAEQLPAAEAVLSFITEIELLSYPGLSCEGELQIREFLKNVSVIDLNDEIKNVAIELRRSYRLKLPDAIICATAMVLDAELVSNDDKLAGVQGFRVVNLRLI
jgi:predicted nucleic acid-binding protein